MIYTKTGSGVGPIAGYIATGRNSARHLNVFSYRKNVLLPTAIGTQPTDPSGDVEAVAWSASASYLVANSEQSTLASANSVKFFSRSGSSLTSGTVPSNFAATSHIDCAISSNGSYIAATGSYSTTHYGRIWHNDNGTLTNLTSVGSFSARTARCALSSDGGYAAFLSNASPFLRIKTRSGTGNSATFADMTLASQPTSGIGGGGADRGGLAFSPDDIYLAVSPEAQADQTVYKFNAGTAVYEKLASPFIGALPDAGIEGCVFSAQGDFLAIATSAKTFFYERSGDTFTAVANVASGNRGNFHPSGNFYITGSGQIYKKNSASSWTAQGSALTAGNAAAFSPYV